jgi:hypothetical protein
MRIYEIPGWVITKKERKYYSAKPEEEKQKRVMSGYLILGGWISSSATSNPVDQVACNGESLRAMKIIKIERI